MTKERINQIIDAGKASPSYEEAFKVLDEVSQLIIDDKKFREFAMAKAREKNVKDANYGYISPTEMFVLAYDYLNGTGKYASYLEKIKKDKEEADKKDAERKAQKEQDEAKTNEENAKLKEKEKAEEIKKDVSIFDLF